VRAFYCDHFVLPLPDTHSFPMAKYRKLRQRVIDEGLVTPADLREPDAASAAELALVHDERYIAEVLEGRLTRDHQRRIGFPWSPAMVERSRRSVGGTIAAALAALDEGAAVNLAGGTHHAFRDRGEGYCVFNDIAVAARVLLTRMPGANGHPAPARIAIIDCDVHQGNGTAAIFRDHQAVFTCSLHGEKNFPFRKETSDLDVTLADGTNDEKYLARLREALEIVFERHRPDFVFYLAGADPFGGDRLGRLSLTIDGLRERDRTVVERCRGVPIAACMGGGYCPDVDTIVTIHANTVKEISRVSCAV
jgi:acetoin utilization deacetylase AcuC-like enzyme